MTCPWERLALSLSSLTVLLATGCAPRAQVCANGIGTEPEACDAGSDVDGDGCDGQCRSECGDGTLQGAESCDDGNRVDGDGCDSNCTPTGCGNGIVTAGEECDVPVVVMGDGCDSNCTYTGCGNGIVTEGEACDDGNLVGGDGCDRECRTEEARAACGDGIVGAAEDCDDGNGTSGDGCDGNCTPTRCGNGVVTFPEEECDDGNAVDDDVCTTQCRLARCGDGVVDPGELCLRTARTYPTASMANGLVAADLDGDGDVDVATVEPSMDDDTLVVLRNDGTGRLQAPERTVIASVFSRDLAAADLDGDADLDLVVAGMSDDAGDPAGTLVPLLNAGDGTFEVGPIIATDSWGGDVETGDLDGDRLVDVVIAQRDDDVVTVLLGDGGGGFGAETLHDVGLPDGSWTHVALADLDVDGRLDAIAASILSDQIAVLLGDGVGGFDPPTHVPLPSFLAGIDSLVSSDFDRDGDVDFAVVAPSELWVFANDGSASFELATTLEADDAGSFGAAGDFDSDGDADILTGTAILENQGDLTFGVSSYFAAGSVTDVELADLQGDGGVDLVGLADGLGVSIALDDGADGLAVPRCFPSDGTHDIASGDLEGDGDEDFVVADFHLDRVTVLRSAGGALLEAPEHVAAGDSPASLVTGDLDAAAGLDVVVTSYFSDEVTLLFNDGSGGLGAPTPFAIGEGPLGIVADDLDGDGHADLVAHLSTGEVSVLVGDGAGRFAPGDRFDAGGALEFGEFGPTWMVLQTLATADFDGDRDQDLAVILLREDAVGILLNDGGASFVEGARVTVAGPTALAVGDVDADGDPDIVASGEDGLSVLRDDGAGGLEAAGAISPGRRVYGVKLADVDQDGDLDLVVPALSAERTGILLGVGDGSFGSPLLFVGGPATQVLPTDVDSDSATDFVALGSHLCTTVARP